MTGHGPAGAGQPVVRFRNIISIAEHRVNNEKDGGAIMAGRKASGEKTGKETGECLTQAGRMILNESMVRHDKA